MVTALCKHLGLGKYGVEIKSKEHTLRIYRMRTSRIKELWNNGVAMMDSSAFVGRISFRSVNRKRTRSTAIDKSQSLFESIASFYGMDCQV